MSTDDSDNTLHSDATCGITKGHSARKKPTMAISIGEIACRIWINSEKLQFIHSFISGMHH